MVNDSKRPQEARPPTDPPHGCLVLFLGWAIFEGSVVLEEMLWWTNWVDGLIVGLVHSMFAQILFVIFVLPFLIVALLVARKWVRSPLLHVLVATLPALAVLVITVFRLISVPPHSPKSFEPVLGITFPEPPIDFRAYRSGGGFIDHIDLCTFRTTPDVVQALIEARDYERDPAPERTHETPSDYYTFFSLDWPRPATWDDVETYWHRNTTFGDPIITWLVTDGKHERVLFIYATY